MHLDAPEADEIAAWLQLTESAGIAPAQWRAALAAWGPPQQVLARPASELARILGHEAARQLRLPPDPVLSRSIDAAVTWLHATGHHFITLADERYPPQLLQLGDPPAVLYVDGDPTELHTPLLALLVSRNASRDGITNARQFADALADQGIALLCEKAESAAEAQGAASPRARVLTQTAPQTRWDRSDASRGEHPGQTFVFDSWRGSGSTHRSAARANRLIAGLARAVLVIEASTGSKPLLTAQLAAECGRDIFAVPGSIHSPVSKGCHRLIKDGAKLVESARDVTDELNGFKTLRRTRPSVT